MSEKNYAFTRTSDKKAAGGAPVVKVKLRGKTWRVDPAALDDAELMEQLLAIDEGNPKGMFAAVESLLGAEAKKDVFDTLRDPETGRVTMTLFTGFFTDLMNALNPNS
ncbi:hypothetical protein [uncultured Rothia sp.]|uniref:hypothetical protein n=1 Tax=uncultured Rothia sp. TaxID=316088 RepID=UPI0026257A51|nr:hypothetical protein [uncultured Rothia sp.]